MAYKASIINPYTPVSAKGDIVSHGTAQTSGYTLLKDRVHVWGDVATLDLSSLEDTTGDYVIRFNSPAALATVVTWPSNLKWEKRTELVGGVPTIQAGYTYEVNISNLYAYLASF